MPTIIGKSAGPHEELLTTERRRKCQWHGCFIWLISETFLQGTVGGGDDGLEWADNIQQLWTEMDFTKHYRYSLCH